MKRGIALPLLAVLLLAACHGESSPGPAANAAPKTKVSAAPKRGPTQDELTAGMVEAVTVGKSTVPISMKFDLPGRPVVGRTLDIVIAVLPQVAGSATLQVSGSDGLQLAPGSERIDIPSLEPTQAYRVTISATPTSAGVQLLSVALSWSHEDATDTRTFSVPLIALGASDAPAG